MANTIVNVSADGKFPVGTAVAAYPEHGAGGQRVKQMEGPDGLSAAPAPGATAVESQTVAAAGTLTFTTLTTGVSYLIWAVVGGLNRWARVTGA